MPLGSNFNVLNTCLRILKKRGYKITVQGEMEEDGYPTEALWIAEKDGFKFMGDNPIELLGLVGIYDYIQPMEDSPYWWKVEGENIWREIMMQTFPSVP